MRKANKVLNIIFIIAIILGIIIIALNLFVLTRMEIEGASMMPTFEDGDTVWVQKTGYELDYNDCIIFKRIDADIPIIKRILGMEGDIIEFRNGVLYRNNVVVIEEYLATVGAPSSSPAVTVKAGELYVAGDNRMVSYDSRSYGCIKVKDVIGKVI